MLAALKNLIFFSSFTLVANQHAHPKTLFSIKTNK